MLQSVATGGAYRLNHRDDILDFSTADLDRQESRAAARKPRDAASVLFGRSSPTTFLASIRLAMLRKPHFKAPNIAGLSCI